MEREGGSLRGKEKRRGCCTIQLVYDLQENIGEVQWKIFIAKFIWSPADSSAPLHVVVLHDADADADATVLLVP